MEQWCCSKIAEAEAAVSVDEKKWLVMHMHVQLQLDEQVNRNNGVDIGFEMLARQCNQQSILNRADSGVGRLL
jgi:hypothetical protein